MGIIRRLILLFYTVAILAAAVVTAGVCLNLIPTNVWQRELNFIISRPETLAVLAVIILASLILLTGVFARTSSVAAVMSGDVELERGKPGEVKITVPAIVSVVEQAAITVSGVRDVEATVRQQSGEVPIKILLTIAIGQGFSAPRVSEAVTKSVDDALATALELQGVPVEIKVNEVTHAILERDRRVV